MSRHMIQTEGTAHDPGIGAHEINSSNRDIAKSQGAITRLSKQQKGVSPQLSEIHHPEAYCPSISSFDWWESYGNWSSSRSVPLYALDDENILSYRTMETAYEECDAILSHSVIADLFKGIVFDRDTATR